MPVFLDAVVSEMNMTRDPKKVFDTLYIGGGTPSVLDIKAIDNIIKSELNGKEVMVMDLDKYTQAGINPQGTPNKYTIPVKDISRKGYVGLQDHGLPVWFRNVKFTSLDE